MDVRTRGSRGFTLVELMIAIALMLVITLQLQIIFNGSRIMFSKAEALVEVFQNARNAIDLMERDLSNAVLTDQMEFFYDSRTRSVGVGHFNNDEVLPELRNNFFQGTPYIHSFAVKQPREFQPLQAIQGGPYRRDAFYFRTYTTVAAVSKEALVEYSLWIGTDPDRPRDLPILQRRITELERIDSQGRPVIVKHPPTDVCYFVQEFKVEPFFRDRSRGSVGRFFSPQEAVAGGSSVYHAPNMARYGSSGDVGLVCVERGDGTLDTATAALRIDNVVNSPQVPLQHVGPGSKVYLLTRPITGQTFQTDFGGYLTIKEIDRTTSPGQTLLRFEEEVAMRTMMGALTAPTLGCDFRAAFLPPAVRISMKIKDTKSEEIRTIQRIFRVGS